jgi:hypothetical protein
MIFYLIFFLLSLGQLGRISLKGQEVNLYLYEVVLGGYVAYLFQKYRTAPFRMQNKRLRSIWIFLGIMSVTFILSVYRYDPVQNLVAFLYLVRLAVYGSALTLIAHHVKKHPHMRQYLHSGLILFVSLTFLFSIAQYVLYPNLRNMSYLGWDPHQFRIFGTFLDTAVSAALYGLIIIHLFFREAHEEFLVIPYVIMSLFTYSRGLYLSLISTSALYLLKTKRGMYIIAIMLFFLMTGLMLPRPFGEGVNLLRTESIYSRIVDYGQGWNVAKENLLTGVGYNHIRYEKMKRGYISATNESVTHSGASFHSSFLIILATGGIFAFAAFLFMLVELSKISTVSMYYIVFLSIFSLTDNVLLHPFVMCFMVLCLVYEMGRVGKAHFS